MGTTPTPRVSHFSAFILLLKSMQDNLDSRVELFGSLMATTRKPTSRSHFCSMLCKSASFCLELVPLPASASYNFAEKNVLAQVE